MEKKKRVDQLIHKFRGAGLLSLFALLFVTGMYYFQSGEEKNIVPASAQMGSQKLPISSVETEQPKVALSFDAAWAAGRMRGYFTENDEKKP